MLLCGRYYPSARDWLLKVFEEKKKINPRFSLHAFSKHIGVSRSTLSGVLSGKRPLATKTIEKLSHYFQLNEKEKYELILDRNEKIKESLSDSSNEVEIKKEIFSLISDWYYSAILSLSATMECPFSPQWVAKNFRISIFEAQSALDTLKVLGLIEVHQPNNTFQALPNALFSVLGGFQSNDIQKFHSQNLQLARRSLKNDPIEKRNINSLTLTINSRNIPEYQKLLTSFLNQAQRILQRGEKDSVYTISNACFPVSETLSRKKK